MANIAQAIESRINAVVAPVYQNGQMIPRAITGAAEIRLYVQEISHIQKQLRLLKTEINNEMKALRAQFTNARANVSRHPFYGAMFGRKNAQHISASERQALKNREHDALVPYQKGTAYIDQFILLFDRVKLDVNRQVTEQQRP